MAIAIQAGAAAYGAVAADALAGPGRAVSHLRELDAPKATIDRAALHAAEAARRLDEVLSLARPAAMAAASGHSQFAEGQTARAWREAEAAACEAARAWGGAGMMALVDLIVALHEPGPDLPRFASAPAEQIWLVFCVYPLPALFYAGHIISLN